jgi:hypothetical protein
LASRRSSMSLSMKIKLFRARQLTERRELTELKKYEGKLARIVGKPFATRLDKAYPRSALTYRSLVRAIEMSNNANLLGRGKANVNGESRGGIYFQATDGSAKGVAWQAAVNVYRATQVGRDVFFADQSHVGTKIAQESQDDIQEKVGTALIQRALRGLGAGASENKVAKTLQKSGVSKEDAFLAIQAAKILLHDMMKEDRVEESNTPLPPLHKWPVKIEKGKSVYSLKDFKVTEKGEPPGSGLYEYELFYKGKSAGKFVSQREVVAKAQSLCPRKGKGAA